MKIKNLSILSFVFCFYSIINFCSAQNLVPNWSFEDTIACPTNLTQIDKAVNWSAFKISPDYFNSCNSTHVGIPLNDEGSQYARTGNAYIGLVTYARFGINAREAVGAELTQQLIIGQKYFITFYVSLAMGVLQHTGISTNKLGVRFSTVQYSGINPIPIDNFAHFFTDSVITDTINWIKVTGSFIADSAYQYLSIGNFFTDTFTTHSTTDSSAAFAYYYIDDVFVSTDSTLAEITESFNPLLNNINVFPNPTSDWIVFENKDVKSFCIFDALGKIYIEGISASSFTKVNVSTFKKGIYFIRFYTSKKSFIQKIILI